VVLFIMEVLQRDLGDDKSPCAAVAENGRWWAFWEEPGEGLSV
jgi:hypothetical protein